MLSKNEIQQLLDKYLMSETSLEEERLLKEYFCSTPDISEEWQAYSVLFVGFKNKGSVQKVKRTKKVWPWLVAACVAGLLFVFLTPPKPSEDLTLTDEEVNEFLASVSADDPMTFDSPDCEDYEQSIQEKGEQLTRYVRSHMTETSFQ